MRKFFAFVFLFFLSISFLTAGDWYVCVGSYAKIGNAEKVYDSLCEADLPALIYRHTQKDGSSLYRVLLDRSFEKRDDARAYISEVEKNPFIIKNGIKGIWIVEVDANNFVAVVDRANATSQSIKPPVKSTNSTQKQSDKSSQQKTTATKNQAAQKSTSQQSSTKNTQTEKKQQPKVKTQQVQNDLQDSPIVYDAPSDTAKKTESQKPQVDAVLETAESEFEESENPQIAGVETEGSDEKDFEATDAESGDDDESEGETENHADITDETEDDSEEPNDSDDLIDNSESKSEVSRTDNEIEELVARINSTDLPPTITGSAKLCIQQLPVNKDFDVVEAYICDFEKSRENGFEYDSSEFPDLLTDYINEEKIKSVAFMTYHGESSEKKGVQVFVAASYPDEADIMNIFADSLDNAVQMATGNFVVSYGKIEYTLFKAGEAYCLYGSTDDNVITVAMKATGLGIVEVLSFLNNFYIGESLSIYPRLEETLFDQSNNANAGQEFVCFCMKESGAHIYFVNAD